MTKKNKQEGGLTDRQLKAIPHLVASTSQDKGCKAAGISRGTLHEWLKDPSFKAEFKSQRDQVIEGALDLLKGHISGAVEALVGLLPTKNEYLRRSVANDIIESVLRGKELEDLERRVAVLEKTMREKIK
ncbi:MAG: hypothetical protein A2V65_01605 [Deltaproteobacteria bacterium RBG_13_49_15]|nr:MAG: hypothetical protein A2V65_01605 [Deltaproteobacteria bacterium RBG_13_49_15]